MYEFFRNLLAIQQPILTTFNVIDPGAVGDNIRSLTLAYTPPTEESPTASVSVFWTESHDKVYEQVFDQEVEANENYVSIKADLSQAAELTKLNKEQEASTLLTSLFEKYEIYSDTLVDGDPAAPTDTMAKKAGKVVQERVFFESEEDYAQFLQKGKKQKPADVGDFKDDLPGNEAPADKPQGDIAPPNLSHEDLEKQKSQEQKSLTKRIEREVTDQVQSALDRKVASVFDASDDQLVDTLRNGKGRTWEEIKEYYIKNLKYEKESVEAYIDQKRAQETGEPIEEEKPEAPKPPENLVSPETHDELVKEIDVEKDIEIEKQDMAIAEIDNQGVEIQKVSFEPLETKPTPRPGLSDDMHPKVDFSGEGATNEDMQEDQADIPDERSEDSDLLKLTDVRPGDKVYVMSDYDKNKPGYSAKVLGVFKREGEEWAALDLGHNESTEVPLRQIRRAQYISKFQKTSKKLFFIREELEDLKRSLKAEASGTCRHCKKENVPIYHGVCDQCTDKMYKDTYKDTYKDASQKKANNPKIQQIINDILSGEDKYYGKAHFHEFNMSDYDILSDTIKDMVAVYPIDEGDAVDIIQSLTNNKDFRQASKKKADPVNPVKQKEIPVKFKDVKISPKDTDKKTIELASPELAETMNQYDTIARNIQDLQAQVKKMQSEFQKQVQQVEQERGKQQLLEDEHKYIRLIADGLEATEDKVARNRQELWTWAESIRTQKHKLTPEQIAEGIGKKFKLDIGLVQKHLKAMQDGASAWDQEFTTVEVKRSPVRESNLSDELIKQATIGEILEYMYENIVGLFDSIPGEDHTLEPASATPYLEETVNDAREGDPLADYPEEWNFYRHRTPNYSDK